MSTGRRHTLFRGTAIAWPLVRAGPTPSRPFDTAPDRVRALLSTIPVGLVGSLAPAGVLAWIYRAQIAPSALVIWLGAIILAHLARFFVWLPARRDANFTRHARTWLFWLRVGALTLGVSWAILPLALMPSAPFDELLVAAVIVAIAGAGMAQQAADLPSVLLLILPPGIPMMARMIASHDASLQAIGCLVILYFIYLTLAASRIQASFLNLSRLHFEATTQSLRDALTGLPNRLALNLRLQEAIARALRNETEVAVAYVDFDDFKQVNDRFGHEAGDELLRIAADRWRSDLRESELIARLGGDEFVLVIEGLDPAQLMTQLTAVFQRLEHALSTPIQVAPEKTVQIRMTMGVARFPADGTGPDELLRRADAAMYQLKLQKGLRHNWWQLGTHDAPQEPPRSITDAYGADASAILAEHADLFDLINAAFIEAFYLELDKDPTASALLGCLDETEFLQLKQRQRSYLRFLAAPDTNLQKLTERARHVGIVHFLAGVSGSLIARSSVHYRILLGEHLAAARLGQPRRHDLLSVIETRLQDELQAQFSAGEDVARLYLDVLARPRPHPNMLWPDAAQRELNSLAELPGLAAIALRRLNRDGVLVVERSASAARSSVPASLFDGSVLPNLDPNSETGQSTTSAAWRTGEIARVDSWSRDPRVLPWREIGLRVGIRSHVSIPFFGADGHVAGVVTLYGTQTNQFASPWMHQWSASVRHRMESIWAQCGARPGATVLSEQRALRYREELFSGGLAMYVQPILNLRTGQIESVEALARLRMPDGDMVSPAVFIPQLGDIELDRVFRGGLDQALAALRAWDRQGIEVDISVNLPPSTLLDPDCVLWVSEALTRHEITPSRLSLELLETQAVGLEAQRDAINRLRDTGIRISMDDLGAGYSSIERLSAFKFDSIKIEQTLIRRIYDRPAETIALVGTLVLLGADLGQSVIVEGVEDDGMLEVVAILGAKYIQGYVIASPMPVNRFAAWLGQFSRPIDSGLEHLRTYAGALAFHWRYVHFNHNHHPAQAHTCPLGRFLREQGYAGTVVDQLHESVHSGTREVADASAKLMAWLAEKVQASHRGD